MQKRILYTILGLGLFIGVGYAVAPFAIAQTTPADRQALIAQLLAQVSALQQQLLALSGTSASSITMTPLQPTYQTSSCVVYRPLGRGATGPDVSCLQRLLISKGLLSSDSATGYFGALTEAAVQQFQLINGIVSYGDTQSTGYGLVGARTRAALFRSSIASSGASNTTYAQSSPCTFNGTSMPYNSSILAYQSVTASLSGSNCVSEIRTCGANGVLSGSYPNASCAMAEANSSCTLDGATVPNATAYTFYATSTVPYGKFCDSQEYGAQTRTCTNGTLSGSATYNKASCSVSGAASCTFASSTVVQNTANVIAYSTPTVQSGSVACTPEIRTCINGVLSGSYKYDSCSVSYASCTLDGVAVSHNQNRTFYATSTVPYGGSCSIASNVEVRTCQNGILSGSTLHNKASCSVSITPNSCAFAGITIPHASTTTAYDATCNSQTRTCTNGVLSGSYTNASCQLASCPLDGVTVAHGTSRTFYDNTYRVWYGYCTAVTRTCTNGTLSGAANFNKAECL